VHAGDTRNLPAAEVTSAPKGKFINHIRDEIVPDIETGASSASFTIEDILRPGRFIDGFDDKTGGSIIDGMGQRVVCLP